MCILASIVEISEEFENESSEVIKSLIDYLKLSSNEVKNRIKNEK